MGAANDEERASLTFRKDDPGPLHTQECNPEEALRMPTCCKGRGLGSLIDRGLLMQKVKV